MVAGSKRLRATLVEGDVCADQYGLPCDKPGLCVCAGTLWHGLHCHVSRPQLLFWLQLKAVLVICAVV
jgi:hypothetical protein